MTSTIKGHLTFSELLVHWQIGKNDLFHLVADNRLFPSIFLVGMYDVFESSDQKPRWSLVAKERDYFEWTRHQIQSEFDENFLATEVNGYYYLRFQRQVPFELEAYYVREKHPSSKWGGRMWRLDEYVHFNCGDDDIGEFSYVVFLNEEVERFEQENAHLFVAKSYPNYDQRISSELADTELWERLLQTESLLKDAQIKIEEQRKLLANASLVSLIPDDHHMRPPELIAANKLWMKASKDPSRFNNGKSVKKNLLTILDTFPEYSDFENGTKERICTVANWNKGGGAPTIISNLPANSSE